MMGRGGVDATDSGGRRLFDHDHEDDHEHEHRGLALESALAMHGRRGDGEASQIASVHRHSNCDKDVLERERRPEPVDVPAFIMPRTSVA